MGVLKVQGFKDQKPGTSGLRKKTRVFMQEGYLETYIQATFLALEESGLGYKSLLVGGDGRFFMAEAIQTIIKIASANGVQAIYIAEHGLLSTPAGSAIIRKRGLDGGFILTASHNPGGIDEDFGVKYNVCTGGPAPESLTDKIFKISSELTSFSINTDIPDIDLSSLSTSCFGKLTIEVIDAKKDWAELMEKTFDFHKIKNLFKRNDFSMVFDAMHGVAGIYAQTIILDKLGGKAHWLHRCNPLPDFGGAHPDPNLVYAKDIVDRLNVENPEQIDSSTPVFGAAADGDGDRNMILGSGFFVTPSDSVAIIAHYAPLCLPFFSPGVVGVSRSMPTSRALDRVAHKLGIPLYEVPTGWKYFGSLMDANRISLCGEESFGTGSSHVREKDGIWAVLCWLSILAHHNQDPTKPLYGVREIVTNFWTLYGRCYYLRYDYEGVAADAGDAVMQAIRKWVGVPSLSPLQEKLSNESTMVKEYLKKTQVKEVSEFHYVDPVDGSESRNQGLRILLSDSSRVVYRLSGTGTEGATIRVYMETFLEDMNVSMPAKEALKTQIEFALLAGEIKNLTGRSSPTVIT